MAAEFHVFAVHNLEASGCRFVVRDTLGVAAADKTDKSVGENYGTLFHYLVVTDYVHNSRGCYDSYPVKFIFGKLNLGNLYYTLAAKFVALKVIAYCH